MCSISIQIHAVPSIPIHPVCTRRGNFRKAPGLPCLAKSCNSTHPSQELLHRRRPDVALLGDKRVELGEQGVHVREDGGDGALFQKRG